jgi:ketosteroid isomerase-like protein
VTDALDIVRRFYSLLAAGKVPDALSLLAPDIEWTEAERSPYYAGTVRGPAAVVETVLGPIGGDFDGFSAAPADFITQDDRVAAFGIYSGVSKATSGKLLAPFVHCWTVRAGHLVRFVQYTDSAAWTEALGQIRRPNISA